MEQRPLRLGDLVDDYCPRERRVTNHAIVAMVEDTIKQTRCTACDADHPYKGGQAPRRRKAETTGRLYKEVLAGLTDGEPGGPPEPAAEPAEAPVLSHDNEPVALLADEEPTDSDAPDAVSSLPDDGPVHRPLIRATLPRPEGVKVERPIPDFTVRHNGNRAGNGNFRDARGAGQKGRGNGQHRFGRGPGGAGASGRNARTGGGFAGGRAAGRHGPRKRSR